MADKSSEASNIDPCDECGYQFDNLGDMILHYYGDNCPESDE